MKRVLLDIPYLQRRSKIRFSTDSTILQLKEYVEDNYEIPIHVQKIIHRGSVLDDTLTLGTIPQSIVKLSVIGHVPEQVLSIHVSDIIEYVIGFLEMEDVRVCCRVCTTWRRLALLGSEFNETRFCFLEDCRTCFDLILERPVFRLPHTILNRADIQPSSLLRDAMARTSKRVFCCRMESSFSSSSGSSSSFLDRLRVPEGELLCYMTYSDTLMWSHGLSNFKPGRCFDKQVRFLRKLRMYRLEEGIEDEDGDVEMMMGGDEEEIGFVGGGDRGMKKGMGSSGQSQSQGTQGGETEEEFQRRLTEVRELLRVPAGLQANPAAAGRGAPAPPPPFAMGRGRGMGMGMMGMGGMPPAPQQIFQQGGGGGGGGGGRAHAIPLGPNHHQQTPGGLLGAATAEGQDATDPDQLDFTDCRENPHYRDFDRIVSVHHDSKRRTVFVQFDSWVVAISAGSAKVMAEFDPDLPSLGLWGEIWDHYTIFRVPMAFTSDVLFVPYRSLVFVLAKVDLGLLKVVRIPNAERFFGRLVPLLSRPLFGPDDVDSEENEEEAHLSDYDADDIQCYGLVNDQQGTVMVMSRGGEMIRPPCMGVVRVTSQHCFCRDGVYSILNVPLVKPASAVQLSQGVVRESRSCVPIRLCENEHGVVAGYYCFDHKFHKYKEDEVYSDWALLLRLVSLFPEYDRRWDRAEHRFKTVRKITTGPIWTCPFPIKDPEQESAYEAALAEARKTAREAAAERAAAAAEAGQGVDAGGGAGGGGGGGQLLWAEQPRERRSGRAPVTKSVQRPPITPPQNVSTLLERDRLYLMFWMRETYEVLCLQATSGETVYRCSVEMIGFSGEKVSSCVRAGILFLHFGRRGQSGLMAAAPKNAVVVNEHGDIILRKSLD